jgi:hypothetical protein
MARPELSVVLVALALASVACNQRSEAPAQGSVTVKLPPARPPAPSPAFSFKGPKASLEKGR